MIAPSLNLRRRSHLRNYSCTPEMYFPSRVTENSRLPSLSSRKSICSNHPKSYSSNDKYTKLIKNSVQKSQAITEQLKSKERKFQLYLHLKKFYGVIMPESKVLGSTEEELIEKASILRKRRNLDKSISKFQKKWQEYRVHKYVKIEKLFINACARKIQAAWKTYYHEVKLPRELFKRQTEAAVLIQKNYRKFQARKRFSEAMEYKRLQEAFEYFEQIKRSAQLRLAELLVPVWRTYKLRKVIRARVETKQKLYEEELRKKQLEVFTTELKEETKQYTPNSKLSSENEFIYEPKRTKPSKKSKTKTSKKKKS